MDEKFNLFIYNTKSNLGHFGLCVIYNENQKTPLIKEVVDEEVEKIYKYCISNNITTLESTSYKQYTCYVNFACNMNGYSQMSRLYLENFYLEIFTSTKLKLYTYFNCSIVLDNNLENINEEQLAVIPSNNIQLFENIEEYKKYKLSASMDIESPRLMGEEFYAPSIENYFLCNELIIYISKSKTHEKDVKSFLDLELNPNELNYFIEIYTDDSRAKLQNKLEDALIHLNNRNI